MFAAGDDPEPFYDFVVQNFGFGVCPRTPTQDIS